MKKPNKRNWSEYNRHLKNHASLDLYISEDIVTNWYYQGRRKHGGVMLYHDHVIEMCLMIREYFGLALRQTEGFIRSLLSRLKIDLPVPDYTTLSRRAARLCVDLKAKGQTIGSNMVLALDSTGLSIHRRDSWNRRKHGDTKTGIDVWRKLHLCVDTASGLILNATYTKANENDTTQTPALLSDIPADHIHAVAADMAYDTLNARKEIYEKKARQLIPPKRMAVLSHTTFRFRHHGALMKERDDAIGYIHANAINGDPSLARAQWKKHAGYHARSLAETAMFRVKIHTKAILTNRTEENRKTQTMIKCKLLNLLLNA